MTTFPDHLEQFNRQRARRISDHERAVANSIILQAKEEARKIVADAYRAAPVRMLELQADAEVEAERVINEAKLKAREIEKAARQVERKATDLLRRAENQVESAKKRVADSKVKAAEVRKEAHAEKRNILRFAKNSTGSVDLLYAAADRDAKRIVREAKVLAEREVKMIREKARAEGLALADVELERRALRDVSLLKGGARR